MRNWDREAEVVKSIAAECFWNRCGGKAILDSVPMSPCLWAIVWPESRHAESDFRIIGRSWSICRDAR